jgi:hypothetical protein
MKNFIKYLFLFFSIKHIIIVIEQNRKGDESMISFKRGKCSKCGRTAELMFSNNPLSGNTICFDCINDNLDYKNLEHADFFCRTYNLPFKPEF